jgi:hypothetical protein
MLPEGQTEHAPKKSMPALKNKTSITIIKLPLQQPQL